jgi:hypothetical protein
MSTNTIPTILAVSATSGHTHTIHTYNTNSVTSTMHRHAHRHMHYIDIQSIGELLNVNVDEGTESDSIDNNHTRMLGPGPYKTTSNQDTKDNPLPPPPPVRFMIQIHMMTL